MYVRTYVSPLCVCVCVCVFQCTYVYMYVQCACKRTCSTYIRTSLYAYVCTCYHTFDLYIQNVLMFSVNGVCVFSFV